MSTDEVNEVISRAERMRETDEKETKRVVARTALETFCQEMKFAFSSNPADSRSQMLLDRTQDCLDWLKQNKGATEDIYQLKLKHLEKASGKVVGLLNNSYGAFYLSFETCFRRGELFLRLSDIPVACEWFYKAYKQAGSKEKEKGYQALLKHAQICRESANSQTDPQEKMKVEKLLYRSASLLVFELKAGARNTSSLELTAELGKLKDVFFTKV